MNWISDQGFVQNALSLWKFEEERISTGAQSGGAVQNSIRSAECANYLVDGGEDFRVFLSQFLDLANGMEDGGVVLPAEILSDLGERKAGKFLAQVHGNLPGLGDSARVVL